jgi:hypothetical protein
MDPRPSLLRTGGRSWPDSVSDRLKLAGLWAWSIPARRESRSFGRRRAWDWAANGDAERANNRSKAFERLDDLTAALPIPRRRFLGGRTPVPAVDRLGPGPSPVPRGGTRCIRTARVAASYRLEWLGGAHVCPMSTESTRTSMWRTWSPICAATNFSAVARLPSLGRQPRRQKLVSSGADP